MDALVAGLIGALVGAVVGAGVTEYFARRRERAAQVRHEAELAAARANVVGDRDRQETLEALEQTRRMMTAWLADCGAVIAGPGASKPGRYMRDAYPRAEARLVGDGTALRGFVDIVADLGSRAPNSGLLVSDAEHMAFAEHAVHVALDEQERRARANEPLRQLSAEDLATLGPALQTAAAALAGRPRKQ